MPLWHTPTQAHSRTCAHSHACMHPCVCSDTYPHIHCHTHARTIIHTLSLKHTPTHALTRAHTPIHRCSHTRANALTNGHCLTHTESHARHGTYCHTQPGEGQEVPGIVPHLGHCPAQSPATSTRKQQKQRLELNLRKGKKILTDQVFPSGESN